MMVMDVPIIVIPFSGCFQIIIPNGVLIVDQSSFSCTDLKVRWVWPGFSLGIWGCCSLVNGRESDVFSHHPKDSFIIKGFNTSFSGSHSTLKTQLYANAENHFTVASWQGMGWGESALLWLWHLGKRQSGTHFDSRLCQQCETIADLGYFEIQSPLLVLSVTCHSVDPQSQEQRCPM